MTQQLFRDVARECQLSPGEVKKFIKCIAEVTSAILKSGEVVRIPGLVSVKPRKLLARPEKIENRFGKQVRIKSRPAGFGVRVVASKRLITSLSQEAA